MSVPAARSSPPIRRGPATALAAVLLAATAMGTARAQAPREGSGFDGVMESLGLKSRPSSAPDFVERSRPPDDALHYVPVGPPRSDAPALKTMTPAEVAATTEALDQARMRQQRGAGLRPVAVPLKAAPAKGAPKANR